MDPAGAAGLGNGAAEVHKGQMFDWNDLRYFLAVARHGSTLAAGRAMGVSQSTVQRRVLELERCVGQPLVKRHPTGYQVTDFGKALLPHAEHVAAAILTFEQAIQDAKRDLSGVVRVACPEPIVYRITRSALLERLRERHPGLQIEFVMSDKYVDLTKGEADVALRSGDTDDGVLVGRKIADSLWAVYASRRYVEQHGAPGRVEDLAAHALVAFDETMVKHRASTWLQAVAPEAHIAARNNSVLGLLYAVKAGIGIAPLPTALGDAEEDLIRVLGPIPELTRNWRILAHPDMRRTPRVSAFFDFMIDEIEALRSIFTG